MYFNNNNNNTNTYHHNNTTTANNNNNNANNNNNTINDANFLIHPYQDSSDIHDILNSQDLLLGDHFQTDWDPQEAILLSDPSFLRQHQLLQEQQKEMQTRLSERGQDPVSNLSAMLHEEKEKQPCALNNKKEKKQKSDIDHQRRFNELQARFRVNYARKPQQKMGTSAPQDKPLKEKEDRVSTSFPSRTIPIQIQRVSRPHSQTVDAEHHQRQLDDQLEKVDFDDITVSELKEMLRQRGKPATGKKAILVQRLQDERKRPMSIQLPTSPYLPGSPSPSLHRSIANMHIGSPPARRYSPYSPRSPKTALSSSVPAEDAPLVSPIQHLPNTGSYQMNRARYYNYKPFTSSALATPDREEVNPFDRYYETKEDVPNDMNIDWLDPSLDILLQQVASQHDGILLSNENLENLLLSQQAHGDISQMHLSSSFESFYH